MTRIPIRPPAGMRDPSSSRSVSLTADTGARRMTVSETMSTASVAIRTFSTENMWRLIPNGSSRPRRSPTRSATMRHSLVSMPTPSTVPTTRASELTTSSPMSSSNPNIVDYNTAAPL